LSVNWHPISTDNVLSAARCQSSSTSPIATMNMHRFELICVLCSFRLALGVLGHMSGSRVAIASTSFENFIHEHGRAYSHGSHEYEERRALFQKRIDEIELFNNQADRLWTAGVNHLSDRTEEELAQLRGWRGGTTPKRGVVGVGGHTQRRSNFLSLSSSVLPDSVSWAHLNSSRRIFNQGFCGSCWAIASSTVLAAHTEIFTPQHGRTFSPQDFIACVQNPDRCGGSGGCDGATVELALDFAMRQGCSTESESPYQGYTFFGKCNLDGGLNLVSGSRNTEDLIAPGIHVAEAGMQGKKFGLRAWERLPENDYEALIRAVAERGPVAVSVAASTWQSYESGIFNNCGKDAVIDHAVTLVGYGHDRNRKKRIKFWRIQNSWGEWWGEGGHIRLLRTDKDGSHQCGTDRQPELGTGCKGGPAAVSVCGMCGILYDNVVPHFERI